MPSQAYAGSLFCSCVSFLRASGIVFPLTPDGTAKSLSWHPEASDTPLSSGVVVLNESRWGHVAFFVLEGEWLVLNEANYQSCVQTKGRRIHIDDPRILAYLSNT